MDFSNVRYNPAGWNSQAYDNSGYPAPYRSGGYSRFRLSKRYSQGGKKHSGCRMTLVRDSKEQILVGWNYSKQRGMLSFLAAPYKGTKTVKSSSGREWENWMIKITSKRTMQTTIHSGMWDCQRRRLIVKELNMVANPGAPNGGYFGQHISKRRFQ